MYFDPKMTLDEYEEFKLQQDEIQIGEQIAEDELFNEFDLEEDYYIDGVRVNVDASEMCGEPVSGYSLY